MKSRMIPSSGRFSRVEPLPVADRKVGNKLIPEPVRKTWTSFAQEEAAGPDFMAGRSELLETDRVTF